MGNKFTVKVLNSGGKGLPFKEKTNCWFTTSSSRPNMSPDMGYKVTVKVLNFKFTVKVLNFAGGGGRGGRGGEVKETNCLITSQYMNTIL